MTTTMKGYERAPDTKGNDVYGKKLYPYKNVKKFFKPAFTGTNGKQKNQE